VLGTAALPLSGLANEISGKTTGKPLVISTWKINLAANEASWEVLKNGGTALDAVETGIWVPEADPENQTVGYGGRPDREGKVTLDACIMDDKFNCGSVAFLQNIKHPISVARAVMEKTPHIMLAGDGALQFALEQGFKRENLLTEKSEKEWRQWLIKSQYKPVINIENHDTIGLLAMDKSGNLSGGCSTSGLSYKMHGRVGDSPIIGASLFVDNDFGAAVATGNGEEMMRMVGAHTVVELMRAGKSPKAACKGAIERLYKYRKDMLNDKQVCYIAIGKNGNYGMFSLRKGFAVCVYDDGGNRVEESEYLV